MPISDIWTLEPAGTPGDAETLSALGFESAVIERASLVPSTLTLSMPMADAVSADLSEWTWKSQWVLRRDGVVYWRGRVSTPPRRSGSGRGEVMTLVLSDALWDLYRAPYTQEWTHCGEETLATARTGRARLGWNAVTGTRRTSAQVLADILDAAAEAGVTIALDAADLSTLTPPPLEGLNRRCGEMVRDTMRWHPECAAWIVSTDDGDTLRIADRGTATVRSVSLTSEELESVNLVERVDLSVDAVHVHYEAEALRAVEYAGAEEGDPATIRSRARLAVFSDIYPLASPMTDETLVITLPAPGYGSGGAAIAPAAPQQPQKVAIKTRPLPAEGASDSEARDFYLRNTGLGALGLVLADIKLPTSTVGNIKAHSVAFAYASTDANDPLKDLPSAINPESSPLFRPSSVSDLPRYLVAGRIPEWLNKKAALVRCQASVGVAKSSVDALDPRERAIFFSKKPRLETISGTLNYVLEANFTVMGTNARTKVYSNWAGPGSSTGVVATDNAAARAAAETAVVIPDLAETLYNARSTAPWEGSVTLTAEECGGTTFLDSVVRLVHADRSEWSTMRALVQAETQDLGAGSTRVTFGAAEHLSPQDFAALYDAARISASAGGAVPMPLPPTSTEEETEEDEDEPLGIIDGVVDPTLLSNADGLGDGEAWDLELVDYTTGEVKIRNPGVLKSTSKLDDSGVITISSVTSSFTVAAGDFLVLEITDTLATTLKKVSTWDGWPTPIDTEEALSSGIWIVKKYYHVLWAFVASSDDPKAIKVKSGVFAERWTFSNNAFMQLFDVRLLDKDGHMVSAKQPWPAEGCQRP